MLLSQLAHRSMLYLIKGHLSVMWRRGANKQATIVLTIKYVRQSNIQAFKIKIYNAAKTK